MEAQQTLLIEKKDSLTTFSVRVQPKASHNRIVGLYGEAVKIQLTAPPVYDRANKALVRFLASVLKVPVRRVRLVAGAKSRNKVIGVEEYPADRLQELLVARA